MSRICPTCHHPVDESLAKWTEIKFTWQCRSCSKIVEWFMVPFDRCSLCGGEMRPVDDKPLPEPLALESLRTALQMELLSFSLYRLLESKETQDRQRKALLARLMQTEKTHFKTLSDRYHIHEPLERDRQTEDLIRAWLVQGVDFSTGDGLPDLYEKAISMERKAVEFYDGLSRCTRSEMLRALYLELAAEERGHAAALEEDRRQPV